MKSKFMPALAVLLMLSPLLFQNCSKSDDDDPKLTSYYIKDYSAVHYFLGGWFGLENQQNWTYDFTIDLLTGDLVAKTANPYCFQSRRLLPHEVATLRSLLEQSSVQQKGATGVTMVDGGYESISFKYNDTNQEKTVFLWPEAAAQGELYFANPTALRTTMQSYVANTASLQYLCTGVPQ